MPQKPAKTAPKSTSKKDALEFLETLNATYFKLHKKYEEAFWTSYMGDHSVDEKKEVAIGKRDAFRADSKFLARARELHEQVDEKTAARLAVWIRFFEQYQSPEGTLELKKKIDTLESKILKRRGDRKEGYTDPYTKKFVEASALKLRTMMSTHDDEKIRKAAFEAREQLAQDVLGDYVATVALRNEYARTLGYTDFYDYKLQHEDGMTKAELFGLFDTIHEKVKYAFDDIRALEKTKPGLRKPWNFGYMLAGDFTKEEDPYFQFDDALLRWGRSFAALGIDYKGGSMQLDLLERKGKYNNGFCHWPDLVHYEEGKRISGSANFTCNVVAGQVGSGVVGFNTLFHEGGHAAHFLNCEEREVCLNQEYAPMVMGWAETHSMFLDEMFSSVEWCTRYAENAAGERYPFSLFERKVKSLNLLSPLELHSILFVANFERMIYEEKDLTPEKAMAIAKKAAKKYFDYSVDTMAALMVPHIYAWESSGSYHGYGLATLSLMQWREYFYKKYGYIVDNPNVGKEMTKVWKLGAKHTLPEFVKLATSKKLSADAFLKSATASSAQKIKTAKQRIAKLETVKRHKGPVKLNATITMVHGKQKVADNKKSFEEMATNYGAWVRDHARINAAKK